jgi:hypothetical protein
MPTASRAHGDRIWWTEVFGGDPRLDEPLLLLEERFGAADLVVLLEARDVERRREGEVFVGMAQQSDASRLGCKQPGPAASQPSSGGLHPERSALRPP